MRQGTSTTCRDYDFVYAAPKRKAAHNMYEAFGKPQLPREDHGLAVTKAGGDGSGNVSFNDKTPAMEGSGRGFLRVPVL